MNTSVLDETVVFPDIPLGFRDQIENLYVVLRSSTDVEVTNFHQHSPMANAIREAFRTWSRRRRVFTPPKVRDQLFDAVGKETTQRIVFEALVEAYEEVRSPYERQQHLPL